MFGKWILGLFATVLLGACAEPKYLTQAGVAEGTPLTPSSRADCSVSFASSGLCLSWAWENKPTATEVGSLIFKTYRLSTVDQTAIEVDAPQVPDLILWMPSMGHGSSPTKTLQIETGTYRATDVFFVMPGKWEMKFQIRNGNEILDEAKVTLTF